MGKIIANNSEIFFWGSCHQKGQWRKKSKPVKKPEETKQGKLCGTIKLREVQSGHTVGKIQQQNPLFSLHYRDSTDLVRSWSKKAISKAQQGKLRHGVRSLVDWKLKRSYLSEVFCLQALPNFCREYARAWRTWEKGEQNYTISTRHDKFRHKILKHSSTIHNWLWTNNLAK